MNKNIRKKLIPAFCILGAFVLWTVLVKLVNVQSIGPQGSSVGFAAMNRWLHQCTGVHMILYSITDWLSLIPLFIAAGFGLLGLLQWIRRRSLWKVDADILLLGIFYIIVLAFFLLFETIVINYRPVLIDGVLEVSYPSSTTMLSLCVMSTAIMQLRRRIKKRKLNRFACSLLAAVAAFLVIGRVFSGVHWFSDIVGGALLSAGLVLLYHALCQIKQ